MNQRHEHADIIHAWAEGARIQSRNKGTTGPWIDADMPRFFEGKEYRIAPPFTTISYRLYLQKDYKGKYHIGCDESIDNSAEKYGGFVQWITEDFQSYTVGNNE